MIGHNISINKSYRGEPYVNLALAVLKTAKDAPMCSMWQSYKKDYNIKSTYHDPMELACWVSEWMYKNYRGNKVTE